MAKIDGMAYLCPNPAGNQLLLGLQGIDLGQARYFGPVEALKCRPIDRQPHQDKEHTRQPGCPALIEVHMPKPPAKNEGDRDKHRPNGHDHRVGSAPVFTPTAHKGMHHQPEQRNCAIYRANGETGDVENSTHVGACSVRKITLLAANRCSSCSPCQTANFCYLDEAAPLTTIWLIPTFSKRS